MINRIREQFDPRYRGNLLTGGFDRASGPTPTPRGPYGEGVEGDVVSDVVYTSRITIEKEKGPVRRATLPAVDEPIRFGVHSEIAEHYGVPEGSFDQHAATLDYVVAAAGG